MKFNYYKGLEKELNKFAKLEYGKQPVHCGINTVSFSYVNHAVEFVAYLSEDRDEKSYLIDFFETEQTLNKINIKQLAYSIYCLLTTKRDYIKDSADEETL
jgi:hypothetical protein